MPERRIKVVDTNVLLNDAARAMKSFRPSKEGRKNTMVIPLGVLGEIDSFKGEQTERGYNARQFTQIIREMRSQHEGNLHAGLQITEDFTVRSDYVRPDEPRFPEIEGLPISHVDKDLLKLCMRYRQEADDVELVTQDGVVQNIADALGIKVSDWRDERVVDSSDEIDAGWFKVDIPDDKETGTNRIIERFIGDTKAISLEDIRGHLAFRPNLMPSPNEDSLIPIGSIDCADILPNHYFWFAHERFQKPERWLLGKYDAKSGSIRALREYSQENRPYKNRQLAPRNPAQRFALDALFDENIKYVTLLGFAGTGKTYVALASGLQQANQKGNNVYGQILVARPVVPAHQTVGFLKGSLDDKLTPWMAPIMDNLAQYENLHSSQMRDAMREMGIEVGSLEHFRGRSLANTYMIVDEAQNLTSLEAKTILTRAAKGTKIVFTGDPWQIDKPHVSILSCGLVRGSQRLHDLKISATIGLNEGERSELAEAAARRL
ncbi:MAG: PhoH family protein [Candidatus Nanoarchaeia archaeon]